MVILNTYLNTDFANSRLFYAIKRVNVSDDLVNVSDEITMFG